MTEDNGWPVIRASLAKRLFLIGLIAVVPACVGLVENEIDLRRARLEEIRADSIQNADLAQSELKQIFEGARSVLQAVSLVPAVRGADATSCAAYLEETSEQVEPLAGITVVGLDGMTRCVRTPADLSDRSYFQEAKGGATLAVGEYTIGRLSNRPRLPLAIPVLGPDHKVMAVIAGAIDLDWLGKQIRERALAPGDALTIADRNGVIIAREPFPDRFVGTKIPPAYDRLVHAAHTGTEDVISQDGTPRLIAYIPASLSSVGLYISAGSESRAAYSTIEQAAARGLIFLSIGCVAALLLAWRVGRRLIHDPVERILSTTERWRSGDFAARTGLRARDGEIEATGEAFDRLASELQNREAERDAAERQRELLIQELNHRVKNVLAVVQSVAVSSLRRDVPAARLADFERRLAIARSHEQLTRGDWQASEVGDIVTAVIEPLCSDAGRVTIDGPRVALPAVPALSMSMLLHELGTNALKYGSLSNLEGRVHIAWSCDGDIGLSTLRWVESGGPAVTPPQEGGFGSRLIVALARRLGGAATIAYDPSGMTCTITFESGDPASAPRIDDPVSQSV